MAPCTFFYAALVLLIVSLAQLDNVEAAASRKILKREQQQLVQRRPNFATIKERRLQLDNGLARTPQMGWNSWNHFNCEINEKVVRETADAIVSSGLKDAGYVYVNLDDCWADLKRTKDGYLTHRPATFPSGMKDLADYVHSKGLKFGIYSDAGYLTCAQQPGSVGYEDKDAKTWASWGVDYLKYDNCYDDGTPSKDRYSKMRDELNATGRPILFSLCSWGVEQPALWASSVGNSWRNTGDIEDFWESMIEIATINNEWWQYGGPGGWNDPDMLEVGNGGMSANEYRVHFGLWALMKAPLLVGCDVRNMTKETVEILTNSEVIAVNQDPLGAQGHRVRHEGFLETWGGPLSGGRVVLALVNRDPDAAGTITARWSDLPLKENDVVTARDIWLHKDVDGTFTGSLTAVVPPREILMLILTPVKDLATI